MPPLTFSQAAQYHVDQAVGGILAFFNDTLGIPPTGTYCLGALIVATLVACVALYCTHQCPPEDL